MSNHELATTYQQVRQALHTSMWTGNHPRSRSHNLNRIQFGYKDQRTLMVSKGLRFVEVDYMPDQDLYHVRQIKIASKTLSPKLVNEVEGVYVEQMVEMVLDFI